MKRFFPILLLTTVLSQTWADTNRFITQFFSPTVISWNPHYAYTAVEAQIFTALYEGLTIFHPATLDPIPGAAEKWVISDDGLSITFTLREDLKWSHGEIITAKDFKESWIHLLSPDTGAEYASLLDDIVGAHEYRLGNSSPDGIGIETPHSRTLIVRLKQPSPQFLSILCHYSFVPVHKTYRHIEDWSDLPSVPVNGPFIIRNRSTEKILMEANPYYWDASSIEVDELLLQFNDNRDEIMKKFNQFEIDWIISGIKISDLGTPETLITSPLFSTTYYYFSNTGDVWSNENVRRALAMLLPWDQIHKDLLIPGTTLVPPIPDYPAANPEFPLGEERRSEALSLLDEAGYPGGKGLPPLTIRIPTDDTIADIMSETWHEELGLEVNIEIVAFPHYYNSVKNGGYDIATLTWTGDYADPHTFLGMWTSKSSFNEAGFSNPRYDTLLQEAALLPHLERFEKLSTAENILLYTGQVMPIEHFPAVNVIDLRFVDGWFPNVLDIHPFKNIIPTHGFTIPGIVLR